MAYPDDDNVKRDTPKTPLTSAQVQKAVAAAHIAFCLDKHASFEVALIREVEKLHGIGEST